MEIKPRDELYCGVNADTVLKAHPVLNKKNFEYFMHFLDERFRIHVRKDVIKKPAPWTSDKVLSEYKFTNVFREDDRVTKELLHMVSYNPDLTLEEKVVNTFLFRLWNNPRTFSLFGGPFKADTMYNTKKLKAKARPVYHKICEQEPNYLWFSSAYNQGGTKRACQYSESNGRGVYEQDIPLRIFHICSWMKDLAIYERLMAAKNQQEAYEIILSLRGLAKFLAYQVFVDLTYIDEFPFSENEFTIAGPGCRKGIDLVFEDKDKMSYEECLFWLRDYLKSEEKFRAINTYFKKHDKEINVMSLENCMCEISKYIRTAEGTGRPRCHYKPRKEEPTDEGT